MIVMPMIILPQLVSKPQYSLVEKIKTIGSTYMVAAGLTPQVEVTCQEVKAVEMFQGVYAIHFRFPPSNTWQKLSFNLHFS